MYNYNYTFISKLHLSRTNTYHGIRKWKHHYVRWNIHFYHWNYYFSTNKKAVAPRITYNNANKLKKTQFVTIKAAAIHLNSMLKRMAFKIHSHTIQPCKRSQIQSQIQIQGQIDIASKCSLNTKYINTGQWTQHQYN